MDFLCLVCPAATITLCLCSFLCLMSIGLFVTGLSSNNNYTVVVLMLGYNCCGSRHRRRRCCSTHLKIRGHALSPQALLNLTQTLLDLTSLTWLPVSIFPRKAKHYPCHTCTAWNSVLTLCLLAIQILPCSLLISWLPNCKLTVLLD